MDTYQRRLTGVLMLAGALLGANAVLVVPTLVERRAELVPGVAGEADSAGHAPSAPETVDDRGAADRVNRHVECCFGAAPEDSPSSTTLRVPVLRALFPIAGFARTTR